MAFPSPSDGNLFNLPQPQPSPGILRPRPCWEDPPTSLLAPQQKQSREEAEGYQSAAFSVV